MKKLLVVILCCLLSFSANSLTTTKLLQSKIPPLLVPLSPSHYAVVLINTSDKDMLCAFKVQGTEKILPLRVARRSYSKYFIVIKGHSTKFEYKCQEEILI